MLLKKGEWPHSMVMTLHGVFFTINRCRLMRTALSCVHSMYQRGTEPKRSSVKVTGVVEIEFKHDHRDGRYKLLDVNPRAWTWNALGSIAGVDFAHVLWRLAMGEAVDGDTHRHASGA